MTLNSAAIWWSLVRFSGLNVNSAASALQDAAVAFSHLEKKAAVVLDRHHRAGLLDPGRKRKAEARITVAQRHLHRGMTDPAAELVHTMHFCRKPKPGKYPSSSFGQFDGDVQTGRFGS